MAVPCRRNDVRELLRPGRRGDLRGRRRGFLPSLAPVSAGVQLLASGLQLQFDGAAQIKLPLIAQGQASFVGEQKPIPVVQFHDQRGRDADAVQAREHHHADARNHGFSNAEAIVRQTLSESVANGLDAALFSVGPGSCGSSARPALRRGSVDRVNRHR